MRIHDIHAEIRQFQICSECTLWNWNNPSSIIDYRSEGCYNALQKMNDIIAVEEAEHGKRKYKT